MSFLRFVAPDLAIDLGTSNILVYEAKKGIVVNEPSVVAIDIKTGDVVAFGKEAYEMIGKTPENIIVVKPLENGVVSDFDLTRILLSHYINLAVPGISLMQPRIVVTAPSGISDVEKRAIEDACIHSGVREVYIVEGSLAAAIGAGLPVDRPEGYMIVNMGAGTTEAAIVSLNGIVASKTLNYGGDYLNKKIIEFIRDKYSVVIGDLTAEELKLSMGSLEVAKKNKSISVSGREVASGMPITIDVYASDIQEAIIDQVGDIVDIIRYILEKNPPELSSDIMRNGVYITGGGSLLNGIASVIDYNLNIDVYHSENPFTDTVKGVGHIVENLDKYKNIRK